MRGSSPVPNRAREFGRATVAGRGRAAEDLDTARAEEARMTPVETKPAARKSRPAANKSALREAIAALNADGAEEYLALFRPDAKLYGFPAGIEDVDDLCRFHAATATPTPTRPWCWRTSSRRASASPPASHGAPARAPAGSWLRRAGRSCASPTARSPSA